MPAAKPFGSVTRIHRELQGKNKEFSAAKRTNRKRIFRVLGFAAAAMLGCALIGSQVVAQSPPPASFQSASLLTFSDSRYGAYSLATGDFNGDGKPDLIIIGQGSTCCPTTADIFLGNGDGTFSLSQAISPLNGNIGYNPHVVAVGDFNGDGHLDFAVAMQGGSLGSLDVYLGDGTGHFTFSANYSYGSRNGGAGSIAVADVNGDGKLDLVVGNGVSDGTITVMLGNGDGTFSPQTPFVCCQNNPSWDVMDVAVADFNNDGHPDIAVADQAGGIDILLNKGDGTFQAPVFYSEPGGGAFPDSYSGIAAADLNHDGNQDVVLPWNGGFWVYLGKGDGTFQTPVNYSTPCGTYGCFGSSVAIADINGDNKLDVIMSDPFASTVWAFLGNGDGTFQPGTGYATDLFPQSIVIADFNGDGKPDFAVGNGDDDQVTIALGNGDGTFRAGANYDMINPYAGSGEVAADFNNDGYLDVATWGSDGHYTYIRVMLNNSHGVLSAPIITTVFGCCTQDLDDVKAGDVNGDGKVDLVGVINETNPQIAVFLGNGNGTFQTPVFYSTGSTQTPCCIALADLRNNGNLDALVSNDDGSLSVLLNNGDGTFGTATVIPSVSGNSGSMIVSGDFNGDGKLDLALADYGDSSINILLGNGDGTFQSPSKVPVASAPQGIAVGDFNRDGKLDLATVGGNVGNDLFAGGGLAILLGNGNGTFAAPTYYSFYPGWVYNINPNLPVVADVNLDGIPDLLVTFANTTHDAPPGTCCYYTNNIGIGVFLGNGDGTFEFENPLGELGITGGPFLVGTSSSDLVVGDFNGDGAPDAAVLNTPSGGSYFYYVTMLLNTTTGSGVCTTATLGSSANPAAYGQAVMLTATVVACEGSPPTGPVTFFDGGIQIGTAPLAGGQATLTISTLGIGSHSITAIFGGNESFKPSASGLLTEVVSQTATATSVASSSNPSVYGQTVTFTTTVTPVPNGGTITLTIDGTVVGTGSSVSVSGLSVGSHAVIATYSGDTDYAGSTSPTLTQVVNPSISTYTLTVTTLGTGNGNVTDNLSEINCIDTAGVQSGTCSASYNAGTTVNLTATPVAPATFGGWGGACTGTPGCSVLMNSAQSVTASFVPQSPTAPVPFSCPGGVYPCSNVTAPPAVFNCPSGTNPCTDPNAHSLTLSAAQVNSPFTLTVVANEVSTTQANGDCQSGQTPSTDFDCRFKSFFAYETLPDGDVIVPACDAYSNGNCVFYSVYYGTKGNEPPAGDFNGPIAWSIAWNNTSFPPPPNYPYQANNPRLYYDPDYEVSPTTPYGTNCSVPMDINGVPTNPPIYCQFVFDITTYYDPTQPPDAGIGGKSKQFSDVVVAFPLTIAAPNLSVTKTADQIQVTAGSPIGYTVSMSNSSTAGTGTATNVTLNDSLPAGSAVNWSISPPYSGQGTCTITGLAPTQTLTCSLGSLSAAISSSVHVSSSSSSVGTYVNTATLTADNNPTQTSSATIQVVQATPQITWPTPAPITYGTPLSGTQLDATASVPGTFVYTPPAGTVLGGGPQTLSVLFTPTDTIDYTTATDSVRLQVNKAAPNVTFTGAPGTAVYNTLFTVTATTNATALPSITGSGPCSVGSVNGNPQNAMATVTMTGGTGTCNLMASWAADSNYNSATLSQSIAAQKATSTTNIISSIPNPSNVGQSVVISFQVTGNGVPTGSVTVSATTGESCSASLTASAGSCSIVFTTAGPRNLTASYRGDSNFSGSSSPILTQVVNGSGPIVSVTPTSISFGNVYLYNLEFQNVTVMNIGNSTLMISNVSLTLGSGANKYEFAFVDLCPSKLAAGKSCDITVFFYADEIGTPSATLNVTDNASGSPQQVSISANVINPQAGFSPTSVNFGTIKVGHSSTKNVTLTNTGTTTLTITSIGIIGTDPSDFTQSNNCPSSLAAGNHCTIAVTFTPTTTGPRSAELTVIDNAQVGEQNAALSGKGSK
jgi:uncharacterized repeat protein (TIGR01451 family)